MPNKTVALYCRVDSGGNLIQQQNVIQMQKKRLEDYANKQHLCVTAYYEDIGYSGNDYSRPGWKALQEGFQAGIFDAVLVVNRSRLNRRNVGLKNKFPFPVIALDSLQYQKER